jgi:ABC-2 type transport system ATP-binding protein
MPAANIRSGVAALETTQVAHRFGSRQALADVSLTVPEGRFVALLGPNGAGKTTLFSIVTRLHGSRAGRVRIFGHDLRRASSLALAELGVVFQSRTLDQDLSVRQNLAYHAALHGLAGPEVRARIAGLLTRAGLADRSDEKVRTLSGGQARRVEIARALVHRPRLLLLDEPTVGLDRTSRAGIVALVRQLVADEGLSVLWATHIFDEIEPDDHVYVLHRGKIVSQGDSRAVMAAASGARSLDEAYRILTAEPETEAP